MSAFPVDLLSAALQQQQPMAAMIPVNMCNASISQEQSGASFNQFRSNSVIVPPAGGRDGHQLVGCATSALGKRPATGMDGIESVGPAKMPKTTAKSGDEGASTPRQPEVLGVSRFISPFSAEAKIPLPHELNELSAHGTTVWKRNQRERDRVRNVNEGYARLRTILPLTDYDRRLSKVDTLRLAIAYIRHLEHLLDSGRAHVLECQCFNNLNSSEGASSAENTPPPN